MVNQIKILCTFSDSDYQIHKLNKQLTTLPPEFKKIQELIDTTEERLSQLQAKNTIINRRLSEYKNIEEVEVEKLNQKKESLKIAQDQKQYLEIKKVIDYINKVMRVNQLQIEKIEHNRSTWIDELNELEKTQAENKQKIHDGIEELRIKNPEIEKKIPPLIKKRDAAKKAMDEVLLQRVDLLIKKKKHPIISLIQSNHCAECGINFPLQVLQQVHRKEIPTCSSCNRFLVHCDEANDL